MIKMELYRQIFSDNLKRLLDINNETQTELAQALNINRSVVSSWLLGTRFPRMNTVEELASHFGVQKSDLLEKKNYNISDSPFQYPFIPDAVAAGIPCTIEGRKELPTIGISDAIMGKYAGNKHILIMRVNGESMNNVIPSGSFIAVKTDIEVKNLKDGDLVVFGKEHEYSLKRFYDANDRIIFKPDSSDPRFTDHVYNKNDSVFIVGRVVLSIRNYE